MSGSLNKVILVGNLGRDPEIRSTQSGDKVATMNIATSENWKDREGNRQEKTEWHRVVIFGKIAEVCERFLKKGSKVLIEGKIVTRKWTDDSGSERYSTEIVVSGFNGNMTMLDTRNSGDQSRGNNSSPNPSPSPNPTETESNKDYSIDLDDEIPF